MPQSEVIFYREGDTVPIRDWLKKQQAKVQIKCLAYIAQLEARGHELRRPAADFLRDGIYELRPSYQGVNYRILYFFAGRDIVVVSHGLKEEREVPPPRSTGQSNARRGLKLIRRHIRTSQGNRSRIEFVLPIRGGRSRSLLCKGKGSSSPPTFKNSMTN